MLSKKEGERPGYLSSLLGVVTKKLRTLAPTIKKGVHPPEQCVVFRRLFDEMLKAGETLLQDGGATNVQDSPLPSYQNRVKVLH